MAKIFLFIFLISATSCSLGKSVVKYDEMCKKPELKLEQTNLIIKTENSCINTALLIYKIDYKINIVNKEILLTAYQATGKPYKTEFDLDLSDIDADNLHDFKFYWINPEGGKTELKVK